MQTLVRFLSARLLGLVVCVGLMLALLSAMGLSLSGAPLVLMRRLLLGPAQRVPTW